MKKITFLIAMIVGVAYASHAQEQGQIRVGAGLSLGTKAAVGNKLGVGINLGGEYFATDVISIAPSYTFYFKSEEGGTSQRLGVINIDGRYYFQTDGAQIYGLLGFTSVSVTSDIGVGEVSASDAGLNLGVGAVFPFGDGMGFNIQMKYGTPARMLEFGAGVIFTIN